MGSIHSIDQNQHVAIRAEQFASPVKLAHFEGPLADLPGAKKASFPLWLWWNVLSLDAPTVAIAWALLFARVGKIDVPAATVAVLAFAVWLIYLVDRVLDPITVVDPSALRERHRFCARHRTGVCVCAALGVVLSVWLAYRRLNVADVRAGMLLVMLVGVYMLCVHFGGAAVSRFFPKEAAVGVIFAAGTALPVWSQLKALSWSGISLWALFAMICTLNCTAIESWEKQAIAKSTIVCPQTIKWAGLSIGVFATLAAAVSLPVFFLFPREHAAVAASTGAALLILLLNLFRTRLSGNLLRVLADGALLAPAIVALIFHR